MSTSLAKTPLVLVDWADSRQPLPGWVWLRGYEAVAPCKCTSVGFLIARDDETVVLAPNMANVEDADDAQISGVISIPSRSVIHLKRLQEAV